MATERLMREDWNKRARADAVYWINTSYGANVQSLDAFFEDGKRWARTLTQPAFERLGFDPAGKTVLEIGSGIGRLFPGFVDLGFDRVLGIDVSDEMVRMGREVCPVPQAEFILTDGSRFKGVPDGTVDFCFSYNVLQHLPDRSILWRNLEETARVLRPGGAFQLHLRARHTLKRRLLVALPLRLRPLAQTLFRIVSLRWLRGGGIRSDTVGTDSTWELGLATPPDSVTKRLKALGFVDVAVLDDTTYGDGMRYWAIGRKAEA
jgi:SAM-dependent methyltransferase